MNPRNCLEWQGFALAVAVLLFVALFAGPVAGVQNQTGNDNLDLELSAQSTSVSAGDSVTVEVVVTNAGNDTSPAPVLDLGPLQPGWNISSWSAPNATHRESTNEWLWTELEAGEETELILTLQSPQNASATTVEGEVTDGRNTSVSDEIEINVGSVGSPTSTPPETATGPENIVTDSPQAAPFSGGIPTRAVFGILGLLVVGLLITVYVRSA